MLFSLGQSSNRKAILRNLLEKLPSFPAWRPSDARNYLTSNRKAILRNLLEKHPSFPAKRPADARNICC